MAVRRQVLVTRSAAGAVVGVCGLVVGFGFVGCIFPDFGKFDGTPASRADGASSGTSGASESGAPDTSPRILCGAFDGGCLVPAQYCCTTIAGPQCGNTTGIDSPPSCALEGLVPGTGKAFLCDGAEDCAAGETCCYEDTADSSGVNAKCTTTCGGKVVCNNVTQRCPAGTSCSGNVAGGDFRACQ